ncbi:hypothetical protein BY458DRAFT_545119 [Sporodiniella umbellata]|nr:hypothetical protein BY458DRAFT_545119 [Sporodiniella umbellata]
MQPELIVTKYLDSQSVNIHFLKCLFLLQIKQCLAHPSCHINARVLKTLTSVDFLSHLRFPLTISFMAHLKLPVGNQKSAQYFKTTSNLFEEVFNYGGDKSAFSYSLKGKFHTITYSEANVITQNLACKWLHYKKKSNIILYIGDYNINYVVSTVSLLRLQAVPFLISFRNTDLNIVQLIEQSKAKVLFISASQSILAERLRSKIGDVEIVILENYDFDALKKEPPNKDYQNLIDRNPKIEDLKKTALILHSSGTSGALKLVPVNNQYLLNTGTFFELYRERDSSFDMGLTPESSIAFVPLLYHCSSTVYLEKLPPSQEEFVEAIKVNKCTMIGGPPVLFEYMIPYLTKMNANSVLKNIKMAVFAGAPLKREHGDWYTSHGVNLVGIYGATEAAAVMCTELSPKNKNWNLMYPMWGKESSYVFEDTEEGLKHLHLTSDFPTLSLSNTPSGGYDTNDLFLEDPDHPGYYTCVGRRDDTVVMQNGKKVNPIPIEMTLRQSLMVRHAMVIGKDRPCMAAVIEVDVKYAMDYSPQEVVEKVYEVVAIANKEAGSHSTILNQMVRILPYNKQLPTTDKGTLIRKQAELLYADTIEKLYSDLLERPKTKAETSIDSAQQIEQLLVECISKALSISKNDLKNYKESVFDLGMTSITAIEVRNTLSEKFENVPQDFLFQHSTIESMCNALLKGTFDSAEKVVEMRYQKTQKLAEEYIERAKNDFPVAESDYTSNRKEKVVLLTGTTGALGSFILRSLLQDRSVKKIYCLIRGQESELESRLLKSFETRKLDTSLLETDRVEVLPMRLSEHYLGLSKEKYHQLKEEVTIVQHCSWLVDFNQTIEHYDKECIAPFYNLLEFAYRPVNPMHVHLVSSVSASAKVGPIVEERPLPLDSHVSMPMGYAQSKFVCEVLFSYLTKEKNFPCYIQRLGQACGDSENGVWNISEQYPLMFITSMLMNQMPSLELDVDWIPMDYAAATISEIVIRTAELDADIDLAIFHIVNPYPIGWSYMLDTLRDYGLSFEKTSPEEWVQSLSENHDLPGYRLMSFYQNNFKSDATIAKWKTNKTRAIAPVLGNTPVLGPELVDKYLKYWQSTNFS